jgi:ribonuclease D
MGSSKSPGSWRSRYRDRQHETAHAQDADGQAERRIEHELIFHGNAMMVDTRDALDRLVEELRKSGSFSYDSEFIGELSYVPKLCLIQIATSTHIALIDPLAGIDLTPFWELLADPAVEKVVHAGEQDIEPVYRSIGKKAANFFDTQIAAGFCTMAYPVALSKLVAHMIGAKLGKALTFTHWDQRPLSPMQLRYAADDVRYLPALRQELKLRLEKSGHTKHASAESEALCDPARHVHDPETAFLRLRGAGTMNLQQLLVLRELTNWREKASETDNVPARTFLRDDVLVELARNPIKSVEKLSRVRGLPRPVETAHGPTIIRVTAEALAMPAGSIQGPRHYEPNPTERFEADSLFASAEVMSYEQSIDPALVVSRQDIGELYRRLRANEPIDDLRLMQGWRRELVGNRIVQTVQSA